MPPSRIAGATWPRWSTGCARRGWSLTEGPWPGCLGVELTGPGAEGYGSSEGSSLAVARLETGEVEGPSADELWRLTGRVDLDGELVDYDQRLTRTADGAFLVHAGGGALRADPAAGTVTVGPSYEALERQLVTTFGLPLLLHGTPAVLLHACAAVAPGQQAAHVFCAATGTGKSTLLAGLISAGWTAVAEDICTVDLRPDVPEVWPGPPWVRLRGPGPRSSTARFQAKDKTAWDVGPWRVGHPVPVGHVVFLQRPGGRQIDLHAVAVDAAITGLAASALWLADPADRAAATFGPVVRVARAAKRASLRLPYEVEAVSAAAEVLSAG